jgi:CHAT domain-containing protein
VSEAGSSPTVVVDDVAQGLAAERAGVHVGDVLISAKIGGAVRRFATPFDVALAEVDEAGRAPVTMQIVRDGAPQEIVLPVEEWGLGLRPSVDARILADWMRGRETLAAGDAEKAMQIWADAIARLPKGRSIERAALWTRAGQILVGRRLFAEATKAFDSARQELRLAARTEAAVLGILEARAYYGAGHAEKGVEPARVAAGLLGDPKGSTLRHAIASYYWADALVYKRDYSSAGAPAEASHAALRILAPESLRFVSSLRLQAAMDMGRSDFEAAARECRSAIEIAKRIAPDSISLAGVLGGSASLAWTRGDLATAETYDREALSIVERLQPGSVRLATAYSDMASEVATRGDLPAAEELVRKGLAIYEAVDPESQGAGLGWLNLGSVLADRGDLAAAERCYHRAVALVSGLNEVSTEAALGDLSLRRRDLPESERHFRRAIELQEKLNAQDIQGAKMTSMLATILAEQGKLDDALSVSQQAVESFRATGPGGMDLGMALGDRCTILSRRGDVDGAEAACREALDIFTKQAPGGLDLSDAHRGLADLAVKRGDLDGAAEHLERAIEMSSVLAPESRRQVEGLYKLGRVRRLQKRLREAAELFRRSIEALEAQTGRLGGSEEVRSAFAAEFKSCYVEYIEVLHELGEDEAAFHGTERYRARRFLAMLAERDLVFDDLPPALAREWREIDADYAQTQAQLAHSQIESTAADLEPLHAHLHELTDKKVDLRRRVREASPRVASLRYPEPLSLAQTAAALDPGTALLSFVVGESQTLLFVVQHAEGRQRLAVLPVPIGDAVLRERVLRLTGAIRQQAPQAEITRMAYGLYRDLVAPAEPLLAKSERLLFVADGPLHRLPFAALVRRERVGSPEYLVEWRPLHNVLSATAYAEVTKLRSTAADTGGLAAFGDPAYPKKGPEDAHLALDGLRSVSGAASGLSPLVFSRNEVESIAALYPNRATVFVGDQATEEQAKEQAKSSRYLHFACHGLLDEQFPINSGLVLAVPAEPKPGQDDGVLQAWEIIEKVRVKADLVTLSACETGLGKEIGGEGLVGLTRAFQYAGAHSVLASLWGVSDESTSDLMKRFYGHLRSGLSKADSLRAAQLELIAAAAPLKSSSDRTRDIGGASVASSRRSSHPFHWAAFELVGDWR